MPPWVLGTLLGGSPGYPSACYPDLDGTELCESVHASSECWADAGCPVEPGGWFPVPSAWTWQQVAVLGRWDHPPRVVICPFAPVDELQLAQAVAWWEDRGIEIGAVTQGSCLETDPRRGRIWLLLQDAEASAAVSETRVRLAWVGQEQRVVHARIYLPPEQVPWLVMLHELGHAVGYGHTHRPGHVMSSRLGDLGPRDDGLRAEEPPVDATR